MKYSVIAALGPPLSLFIKSVYTVEQCFVGDDIFKVYQGSTSIVWKPNLLHREK